MLLLNAFSLNMLTTFPASLEIDELTLEEARGLLAETAVESAVGHADTAALFSTVLGLPVPCNRVTVVIDGMRSANVLVGQYSGPRLPEGATTLPEGASIKWLLVSCCTWEESEADTVTGD